MATTPTRDRLGKVTPGINRTIASVDTTAAGRGLANLGAGLSSTADDLGRIAEKRRREENTLQVSKANAGTIEGNLVAQREAMEDGDFAAWGDRYTERIKTTLEQNASLIKDPKARSLWIAQQGARVAQGRQAVLTRSEAMRRQKNQQDMLTTIETLQNVYTDPVSADDVKSDTLNAIREHITVAEQQGLIDPKTAKDWRDTYDRGSILKEAQLRIENDAEFAAMVAGGVGGNGGAAALLRAKEGFRSKAYWDVNAWRTGYGSDTVTRADGSVERVTENTVITRADAERDLARRLKEFEGVAAKQTGFDAWAGLSDNARAALISVTYNYGSLPKSVVRAIHSGDIETVAQAVEGLSGHNGGINAKRRKEEAAIIRGSAGLPAGGPLRHGVYADLSPDQRQALIARASKKHNSALVKASGEAYDGWHLAIETEPFTVKMEDILNDPNLDDGQRKTLIGALKSALEEQESVRSVLETLSAGSRLDPYNSKTTKAVNSLYRQEVEANADDPDAARMFAERYAAQGVIPKDYANLIKSGLNSSSASDVAQAAGLSFRLAQHAPDALKNMGGSDALLTAAAAYDHYANEQGLSGTQVGQKIMDMSDPELRVKREALLKSPGIEKKLDKVDADYVAKQMSEGSGRFTNYDLGVNEAGQAYMVTLYKDILEDSLVDAGGDFDLASDLARARFGRRHGASQLSLAGEDTIIRNPIEKANPSMPDGSHDYLTRQAAEALEEEGIQFDADTIRFQPVEDNEVSTERALDAGTLAPFQVFYEFDGQKQSVPYPFFADPQSALRDFEAGERAKTAAMMESSKSAYEENRANQLIGRELSLDAYLDGPDKPPAPSAHSAGRKPTNDATKKRKQRNDAMRERARATAEEQQRAFDDETAEREQLLRQRGY